MAASIEPRSISLAMRIYGVLLSSYPEAFREQYTTELLLVFRDRCREVLALEGAWGLIAFWIPVLLDLVKTSVEEHTQRGGDGMMKSTLIRLAGPLLLLGGTMFLLGAGGLGSDLLPAGNQLLVAIAGGLTFLAFVPIGIGLVGVYLGYGRDVAIAGRIGLGLGMVAAIGSGLVLVVFLSLSVDEFLPWFSSTMIVHVGMLVFGVTALSSKPLPRWNGLPLLIGISGLMLIVGPLGSINPPLEDSLLMTAIVLNSLAWMLMGFSLLRQIVPEPAAA